MDVCAFCEIVSGRRPALVVFESQTMLGFLDHRPLFPGHVLVIPRPHCATIEDLPEESAGPLLSVVRRTAAAVRNAVDAEGTFMAINNVVSQSVPHLHVHVVPRRRGDGLRGFFWPRVGYDDDGHAEAIRRRIADEFNGWRPAHKRLPGSERPDDTPDTL